MTEHAQGTFTVAGWDESTYQELDGPGKLTKARMTFDFSGELTGRGVAETVMCYREDGTAVYTGLQHMVGQVAGRSGSYVLRADGAYDGDAGADRPGRSWRDRAPASWPGCGGPDPRWRPARRPERSAFDYDLG